jgi:hypothetical protein
MSGGLDLEGATRGGGASVVARRLTVAIYVRAEAGSEGAAEDQLDTLVEAAALALADDRWEVGATDAAPDGAPLRNIDGALYRVERFTITR